MRTQNSVLFFIIVFSISRVAFGQDWKSLGVDDLFKRAQKEAFSGDRKLAREMLLYILTTSPRYHDVRILLGRTYAWDGQHAAARNELALVLEQDPENLDALNASTDVEIWAEEYQDALTITSRGLREHPNNEDLLVKRASVLHSLQRDKESVLTLNRLLEINPSHEKGLSLLKEIRIQSMKYTAGVSYSVDLFDRTFDPAHYALAQLGRTNRWGTSILRLNWAQRFNTDGWQPEIDLYPKIANGIYAYLNYGYSNTDLFPEHRVGAELYSKLPASFEASAGLRHLSFDRETKVNILTASLAWYVKDYWLSLRSFVTPDEETGTSVSGSVTARKYFSTAETFVGFSAGLGFSPDVRRIQSGTGLSSDEIHLLRSQRVGLAVQKLFGDFILNVSLDLNRQELLFDADEYVLITGIGVSARKRF